MKRIMYIPLVAVLILIITAVTKNSHLVSWQSQVESQIIPPISICGTPGARTILKIMDTTRQMAPLMDNLGDYSRKVSTQNERAQKFFNQGLILYYGFNHLEAYRSFKEAARLDSGLAMAYWGQALSLGPNINLPMNPADTKTVYQALQKALLLRNGTTAVEQALILALSKRYTAEALEDRSPLDEAYATAMAEVSKKFPQDEDVNTLYAEALMDLHPWDFWKNGNPQPWTALPIQIINHVLSKNPDHPGANHLNIHILEASTEPEKAVASADRLQYLVPGSGHLIHMPSHVYIRVGRYMEGVESNERAVKTDEEYITQCKVQGVYPLFYYPHNYHFLLACSQMAGMSEKSALAAEALQKNIPVDILTNPDFATLQHWYAMPWYNLVRFGRWNDILSVPEPADSLKYVKAVWHYMRGMAYVRSGKASLAKNELFNFQKLLDDSFMELKISGFNSFRRVLQIGEKILQAEMEVLNKKYENAIAHLTVAIEMEDNLLYQEPPDWYHPTRQVLGSVLLKVNKPSEAERKFREDLEIYRDNGWSLFGLYQSLEAQGKKNEAREVKIKFEKAFAKADITLKEPRF